MALFILCGTDSSSVTRFYTLSLITLVFVCTFSYCSSFGSSRVDFGNHIDKNLNDENTHYYGLPYQRSSSGNDYINDDEYALLAKNHLLKLLLKSALSQEKENHLQDQYEVRVNNRRYAPQSFHAMRG